MYDKDFAELVKIAAEKLKEDTVYKMLIHSEDYQKESDERASVLWIRSIKNCSVSQTVGRLW